MCCNKIDKIKEELADVFIYATLIAECYGFDIEKNFQKKLKLVTKNIQLKKQKGDMINILIYNSKNQEDYMIIYEATKEQFIDSVFNDKLEQEVNQHI